MSKIGDYIIGLGDSYGDNHAIEELSDGVVEGLLVPRNEYQEEEYAVCGEDQT